MRVAEIVDRLWPGGEAVVTVLGGGITNHNFKVEVGGKAFVLRIGGKETELLGIDRAHEHAASVLAASLGVGPEVVAFVEPEGYLVTRFVQGTPVPPERMPVAAVGETLRLVHGAGAIPSRFDSFRVVETYREIAEVHGVRVPAAYAEAKQRADAIEVRRGPYELCPCHNDLLNANFIDDGERLRIVDWEYAGMGDPFFDLGNFAVNHELDAAGERALLTAYLGEADETTLELLREMRFMSDFREAMWGVVQQGISQLDVDFVAYADEHFARALA
jgi:aminoglycoside phosphotransferase (APT) family kinase protein